MIESLPLSQLLIREITVLLAVTGGILVIGLGYRLFVRGVSGQFQFKSDLRGFKADLVSAGPGLLFALLGAFIVWTALNHGFEMKIEWNPVVMIEEATRRTSPVGSQPDVKVPPGGQYTINIIAHSMGGEVARIALSQLAVGETLAVEELVQMARERKLWKVTRWEPLGTSKEARR